ncbi:uncharacterized protein LOC125314929 [Rhodamnia argentea]|uniref:Uncharacterized protein LOC125314929 n=1 Tax=Rhodamnia argentea TaxID=178133 RepID=A0ABM3HCK6_9MYRT|nr:uncharacterized protein LOC125314929 [Rhodamnia argentea]
MMIGIASGECTGFITGEKPRPTTPPTALSRWLAEDASVKAFLLNHMTDGIRKQYVFMQTARDIWVSIKDTYFETGNDVQIYELMKKIRELRRGESSAGNFMENHQESARAKA